MENNTQKLTAVCLPHVKGLLKIFKRYVVYMIWRQYSGVAQLFENISSKSSSEQKTIWPRIVYIPSHATVVKLWGLKIFMKVSG